MFSNEKCPIKTNKTYAVVCTRVFIPSRRCWRMLLRTSGAQVRVLNHVSDMAHRRSVRLATVNGVPPW